MTNCDIKQAVDNYLRRTGHARFEPKAALIDMDGTLYDSMKSHTAAWHRMMTEVGITTPREEYYLFEGMTGAETINMLFKRTFNREATEEEKTGLYKRKTEYFNELPKVGAIPGADRMLSILAENNISRVLVTGSGQSSTIDRLKTDFPGAFLPGMMITSRDVARCKPDPEPYLKAMRLAHVDPWQSIVVENAPLGVTAGSRAGAFTVGITTGPIPAEEMWRAGADIVFPTMETFADALPALLADHTAN